MKQKVLTIWIVIYVFLFICSCSPADKYADAELDTEVLVSAMQNGLFFDDELVRLDDELVAQKYNFGGNKTVILAGSGATAEEIIIVEYSDAPSAKNGLEKLNSHLSEQKNLFKNYNASEMPKLESALCRTYGRFVIYCVSSDTAAAENIIDSCIK